MNGVSLRQIARKMKKFHLSDGDVLAIRSDSPLADESEFAGLQYALEASGLKNITVVIVDDLNDMRAFNEEQMNRAGWFRVGQLARAIHISRHKGDSQDGKSDISDQSN